MKKRLRLYFLFVVTLLGIFPMSAYDFLVDGIYYNIDGGEASVTNETGGFGASSYSGKVVIPSTVLYEGKSYSVTSIGLYAFSGSYDLTGVTIPASVTTIGGNAFAECIKISSITIPSSVTAILGGAFSGCSSLTSITIPSSVTTIGEAAFSGCSSLSSITIPSSVTTIGSVAFLGTPWWDNQPDGLIYIHQVLYMYKGTMPENTQIEIQDGVVSISDGAFSNCSGLTEVTIPNSVTTIGALAFSGCSSLSSITIPPSVMTVGNAAFSGCSGLTSITLSASMTGIGDMTFYNCSGLTAVAIPDAVERIGEMAFSNCKGLTSVSIGASMKSISPVAFTNCSNLETITVSDQNNYYSSLDSILYNKDQTVLCLCAKVKATVNIPEGVTSIDNSAFWGCLKLTTVTLPASLESIGEAAFAVCGALKSIVSNAVIPPVMSQEAFIQDHYLNAILYVPADSKSAYQSAAYWSNFTNIMELPSGVESVDGNDMRIYAVGRTLYVENTDESYRVCTATGQLVYAGDEPVVLLPGAGVYIVCAGNRSQKVLVK